MERHAEDIAIDALFAIAHILRSAHLLLCRLIFFHILHALIFHLICWIIYIVYHLAKRFPLWCLDCIVLPSVHPCEIQIPYVLFLAADMDMMILEKGAIAASECLCQEILGLSGNIRNLPEAFEECLQGKSHRRRTQYPLDCLAALAIINMIDLFQRQDIGNHLMAQDFRLRVLRLTCL